MQHTQADILRAIADGKPVQCRIKLDLSEPYWTDWLNVTANEKGYLFYPDYEWRIVEEETA